MRKALLAGLGLAILYFACSKEPEITSTKEQGIRFVTAQEIENMGGYAINEADFSRSLKALGNDKEFMDMVRAQSGGGLEFPIPCHLLLRYLEKLIGVDLDNAQCKARGKLMIKPSLDVWVAGNLAYAIDVGGYLGAAGYAGFSGSIAGAQELGLLTIVYINNQLDTMMWNYNYNNESNVAFNAGFVVWTSETGGVTIDITTDHTFSNGQFDWNPVLVASYSF